MYQVLWSSSVCQLSYLPCIKYVSLPVSVSCPVCTNVIDEECLPLIPVCVMCVSVCVHVFQLMGALFNSEEIPTERQDEHLSSEDIHIIRFTLKKSPS